MTDKIIEFFEFYLASFRLLLVVIACAYSHTHTGHSPWSRDHFIRRYNYHPFRFGLSCELIATLCSLHIILFSTPLPNASIPSPDFSELPFWLLLLLYCHLIHFNDASYFHWKFCSLFVCFFIVFFSAVPRNRFVHLWIWFCLRMMKTNSAEFPNKFGQLEDNWNAVIKKK